MPRNGATEATNQLGSYLSSQLRQRGMDAKSFAQHSKIPEATISRIINGSQKQKMATLLKIADGLDVPPIEVLTVAGYDLDGESDDKKLTRLNRLVEALPWLSSGLPKIAELSESEFAEILQYIEFRQFRRKRDQS